MLGRSACPCSALPLQGTWGRLGGNTLRPTPVTGLCGESVSISQSDGGGVPLWVPDGAIGEKGERGEKPTVWGAR